MSLNDLFALQNKLVRLRMARLAAENLGETMQELPGEWATDARRVFGLTLRLRVEEDKVEAEVNRLRTELEDAGVIPDGSGFRKRPR